MRPSWIEGGDAIDSRDATIRQRILQVDRKSRTQSSVTLSRDSAAPAPPRVFRNPTVNSDVVRFSWYVVRDPKVSVYNIYRSNQGTNPFVAERIAVIPQSPDDTLGWIEYEDSAPGAPSSFYWIASANAFGTESPRVLLRANVGDVVIYVPARAGAPTAVPTAKTGYVAMLYDTTADKLYVYNGSWKASGVFA